MEYSAALALMDAMSDELNAAEQAVALIIRPRREEERIWSSSPATVPERKRPKALNDDRVLMEALEETPEVAVSVERHDSAAAEIPNQKLACVFAESSRR